MQALHGIERSHCQRAVVSGMLIAILHVRVGGESERGGSFPLCSFGTEEFGIGRTLILRSRHLRHDC